MTVPPMTGQPRITLEDVAELRRVLNAKVDAEEAVNAVVRRLTELHEIREGDAIDGWGYITRKAV